LNGERYVTESFGTKHQIILGNVSFSIGRWLEERPTGKLFFAPVDVVFSPFDVVVPDMLYMSNARAREILTDANVQGVPELIVEIAAPNTRRRDETFKRRLYERVGVTEYWVIDALIDNVHVYRRTGERFARPVEFLSSEHDVLTTPLLAGFELPLADIFDTRGLSFPSWY
jgi:Uma2 family endonuclease